MLNIGDRIWYPNITKINIHQHQLIPQLMKSQGLHPWSWSQSRAQRVSCPTRGTWRTSSWSDCCVYSGTMLGRWGVGIKADGKGTFTPHGSKMIQVPSQEVSGLWSGGFSSFSESMFDPWRLRRLFRLPQGEPEIPLVDMLQPGDHRALKPRLNHLHVPTGSVTSQVAVCHLVI